MRCISPGCKAHPPEASPVRPDARGAGAPMDDANLNRRQTIRVGPGVAYAQVGVLGFDSPIDLRALRL